MSKIGKLHFTRSIGTSENGSQYGNNGTEYIKNVARQRP